MKALPGKVAALTGAGSGIGRALAVTLAEAGVELALSDIDDESLSRTRGLCRASGVRVTTTVVDVSNRDDVFAWAAASASAHGRINLVINNPGVNLVAGAAAQSIEDFHWLMDINFWGVVHGTQAFLPHLRESGDGHVVNISSVFGLMSIPSQSAYNASKFAVRGFSDALRMELEMEGASVSVTTVHPGGIRTAIARNARVVPSSTGSVDDTKTPSPATRSSGMSTGSVDDIKDRFDRIAITSPDKAAREIVRAIQRNRRRALIGPDAALFDLVSRLPAPLAQRITMAAIHRTMGSALPKT